MYLAVCDDQSEELNRITDLLQQWQAEHPSALRFRAFRSAAEMLDAAKKKAFTLYLLDVMMPGTDGMAAAREIRSFDEAAAIVFLTSSPGFAYESYGVRALDYLLKPVSAKLLFPLLNRLYRDEQKPEASLTLKIGSTLTRLPFSQIAYVEVNGKHLYFNLADGDIREVSGSLKDYEAILLAHSEFHQIHRSYIVNMSQVCELSPTEIRTASGKHLPVSRNRYPELQKAYLGMLFERGE